MRLFACLNILSGGGDPGNTCLGHHEIAGGAHGNPGWGEDGSRHGFMNWVLCCAQLPPPPPPLPLIFSGDWINAAGAYNSWGAATDYCIAQGAEDLCPFEVYCPDGGAAAPFGGRQAGRNGDDQWAPFGGDGSNRWVQTGIWNGDPGNTCLGHHQISGGAHGNPGWGTGNQGVADAGYMDWVLCCGGVVEPAWFDGDYGATWGAGSDFCTDQEMSLCPYSTYCPDGGGSSPLGGTKDGDKWSPFSDGANRWVQVGVCECANTQQLCNTSMVPFM